MTTASIISEARRILADTVADYRWPDDELRGYVQLALRRLNARVPSTRYVGGQIQDGTVLPDDDDETIPVDERYAEALALYIAHLAYRNDATDTVNAERSATYLARAEALMI